MPTYAPSDAHGVVCSHQTDVLGCPYCDLYRELIYRGQHIQKLEASLADFVEARHGSSARKAKATVVADDTRAARLQAARALRRARKIQQEARGSSRLSRNQASKHWGKIKDLEEEIARLKASYPTNYQSEQDTIARLRTYVRSLLTRIRELETFPHEVPLYTEYLSEREMLYMFPYHHLDEEGRPYFTLHKGGDCVHVWHYHGQDRRCVRCGITQRLYKGVYL